MYRCRHEMEWKGRRRRCHRRRHRRNESYFFDRSVYPVRRHHIYKSHIWISNHLWWRRRLPSLIADSLSLIENLRKRCWRRTHFFLSIKVNCSQPESKYFSTTSIPAWPPNAEQTKAFAQVVSGYNEIWCKYMSFDCAKSRWQKRKNPIQNIHHDFVRQLVPPSRLQRTYESQQPSGFFELNLTDEILIKNDAHFVS